MGNNHGHIIRKGDAYCHFYIAAGKLNDKHAAETDLKLKLMLSIFNFIGAQSQMYLVRRKYILAFI